MRVILVQAYTAAEVRGDLNTQGFKEVHRKFDRWLQAIVYEAGTIQLHLGLDEETDNCRSLEPFPLAYNPMYLGRKPYARGMDP